MAQSAYAQSENEMIFKAFQDQYCDSMSEKYKAICNRYHNSVEFLEAVQKQGSSEICGSNFLKDMWDGATSKTLTEASERCKAGTEESRKISDIQLAFFRGAKAAGCGAQTAPPPTGSAKK